MTNNNVVQVLDVVKDNLADIAQKVYEAQADGNISVVEGLLLGVEASTAALQIVSAIRSLNGTDVKELLDALRNSDLVVKP